MKNNKNKDDIKIIKLDQLLQEIFHKLSISNLDDLDTITDDLLEALEQAQKINAENDRLANLYGGNFAFVKTYKDCIETYSNINKKSIEKTLISIYNSIKDLNGKDSLIIQGKTNFINTIKRKITPQLLKDGIYSDIKTIYDKILSDLYMNIQIIR